MSMVGTDRYRMQIPPADLADFSDGGLDPLTRNTIEKPWLVYEFPAYFRFAVRV